MSGGIVCCCRALSRGATMPTFAATFAGARVVIDITPMTVVEDIARDVAAKAKATTTTTTTVRRDDAAADGDDVEDFKWDLYVDGVAVAARDRRTAFRLMNFKPTARFEVRQRAGGVAEVPREAQMKGKTPVARPSVATAVAASEPTAASVSVAADVGGVGREYRVIRREVEIDEGPGAPPTEVADDFFELTVADAVALTKRSTAEPILMTKKMRENAAKEKKRPSHAIIRFLAPPPSDLIIEGLFDAEESGARAMYDFIAKFARSPAVAAAMEVFVTPPKRVFARGDAMTFLAAGLAPAARVRVGVKGSPTYESSEDAERALFSDEVIAQACGPVKKSVRPVPATSTTVMNAATDALAADASPTVEEKKQKLMDKLKAGGKPKWFKI